MFKTNVGTADRIVRVAIGLVLVSLAIAGPLAPWGYIGIVPIATALFSTCPLYSLLGISTCATRPADQKRGS